MSIMSRPPLKSKEVEPGPVQLNVYQSNTYRKDLSWLNYILKMTKASRESANEGPFVLHIRFCSLFNNSK